MTGDGGISTIEVFVIPAIAGADGGHGYLGAGRRGGRHRPEPSHQPID